MSVNLAKASAQALYLSQQLQIRLQQNGSAGTRMNQAILSTDATGLPTITMSHSGTVTAGSQTAIIRFSPVLNPSPTLFGQPLASGTPSNMQLAYELSGGIFQYIDPRDLALIYFQSVPSGNRLQVYQIANATPVTVAAIDAQIAAGTGPAVEFDELYWPGSGNV